MTRLDFVVEQPLAGIEVRWVERDEHAIRVEYAIGPDLDEAATVPHGEAVDDRENVYGDVGGAARGLTPRHFGAGTRNDPGRSP